MDEQEKRALVAICTSEMLGIQIGLDEILSILIVGTDPDVVREDLGGVEPLPCNTEECYGATINREDGRIIILPTLAAQAENQGVNLLQYLVDIIDQRRSVVDEVVQFWQRVEDAQDDDALEEAAKGEDDLSPMAQELLAKIRFLMYQQEIRSRLGMALTSAFSAGNGSDTIH